MLEGALVLVALAAAAVGAAYWRRRLWRRTALRLYTGNAAIWGSARPWTAVASGDPEPWRAEMAGSIRRELEDLGFLFAGHIQHSSDAGGSVGSWQVVMSVFVGDGGKISAASYELDGHEIVELESEFVDGYVVATGNNEVAGRLTWPPGFDVQQKTFDFGVSALLPEHRERLRARAAKVPEVAVARRVTLEDVLASQNRQQAAKQAFRQANDFLTEEEFRRFAKDARLSRSATAGILTEYQRLAREVRRSDAKREAGRPTRG